MFRTPARLRHVRFAIPLLLTAALNGAASAQKKYDVGATDTEIKIGNIVAYSGPVSSLGVIAKIEDAYFRKVNDEGGINGRKIKFISYDDAYSPPKSVEQARKLVESDEVLLVFNPVGTPSNVAIQKYLNAKKVPQLFVGSGATRWNDPKDFPWTMGYQPNYQNEGRIYAKYLLREKPDARIAVLYQNDDLGKDYLKGLKDGLGQKASMIVAAEGYETSEPTVDSHIVNLRSTGADVFIAVALTKVAAQSIRKVAEIGWNPLFILSSIGSSIGTVIQPVGFDKAQGLISTAYLKDSSDPQWNDDEGMKKFYAFLAKYAPDANKADFFVVYGYGIAQTMTKVLQQCGDDLTRENVMRQAASLTNFMPDVLLPGISINTSASDFAPIEQMRMIRLKGEKWELFGDVINGSDEAGK
ncbi:ABC transporter substrate-binding protein [Bradyrhizobium sp. KBS0727]|uniref:ABC transporter substrate-binding protein n=1 Tax=unclassified Bradyrhizobium TaxID=2631580 RepID=UPI00110F37E8|nr:MULTISPECIES: ABC transporter substrate-binding protein [unclassified Bradyrhizobium]QDW40623.1 ABC transporter substrate-binding protein [Bradyrhizobium sp. KBS0725]QDW47228.1 ABC transporter substrate-binding protein [Bradyrhizobium sp. KBS0727]